MEIPDPLSVGVGGLGTHSIRKGGLVEDGNIWESNDIHVEIGHNP